MSKFSTGHPQLDNRIGGTEQGDVILFLHTGKCSAELITRPVIDHSVRNNIPLYYFSINDAIPDLPEKCPRIHIIKLLKPGRKPDAVIREMKRLSRTRIRNGYVIIDDLSAWKQTLKKDSLLVEAYSF